MGEKELWWSKVIYMGVIVISWHKYNLLISVKSVNATRFLGMSMSMSMRREEEQQ